MQIYSPTSLEKGLKVKFLEYFATEGSLASQIAYVESSDSDQEKYDWLGHSPQMQEFIDERRPVPMSDTGYTIKNKTWESTIIVSRNDLQDGKTGALQRRIQQLASTASGHVNKLLIETLVAGIRYYGYDGVPLFSASHPARADEGTPSRISGRARERPPLSSVLTSLLARPTCLK